MDKIRQHNWLSITAYVLSSLGILAILLFFAETYFPSQSNNLFPHQSDRISRWLFNSPRWQNWLKIESDQTLPQNNLFLKINQKQLSGKSELIYRGLKGRSQFRIDLIIPELDPYVSYPYEFKISEAEKSFRLANRYYRLVYAKEGALRLELVNPQSKKP